MALNPHSLVVLCLGIVALGLPLGAALREQGVAQPERNRVLAAGSPSELAIFLANQSMSAGVVAASDSAESVTPAEKDRRAAEWLNRRHVTPEDLLTPPDEPLTAQAALLRFAALRQGRWRVRSSDAVPMIVDDRAIACQRILRRPTTIEISEGTLTDALATLMNGASPGSASSGWVGTCGGVGDEVGRFELKAGDSLEKTLNQAVARLNGVVWYAVDNGLGGCSFGIIERRTRGSGACQALIAADVR
jgi:hypothetical protein